ncbi:TlpA family protein disulfide reductase [Kitasatospora sp. NBC_01250]|uniref:TlpA family protein disulfide reductase n=1 Tax=unclassified Kitasatospora TaxID=2633591 RepID=UPI002E1338CD|nr:MULTISPECIES: TlpA disulfide reductase family protein [unclassified Kitasatospora]WSJ67812.1 TlpA family protein disulfide reductase [Kitasatospora sp. NBC_01302]
MSGTPRFRLAALFTAAAAVLALAGCSSTGSGGSADAQGGFVAGQDGLGTVPPANRKPAPAISGKDLENKQVALSDYTGKIVVINAWGSWCSACRSEAAGLEQSYQKYKDQGVEFLGINTRDTDPTNARQFEENHGIAYPSIYDPDGTQILKFPKGSVDLQALPATLVVDRQGRLAARAMRAVSSHDLDTLLEPLLAEQHS